MEKGGDLPENKGKSIESSHDAEILSNILLYIKNQKQKADLHKNPFKVIQP